MGPLAALARPLAWLVKFLGHDHEIEAPLAQGRVEVVDGDPARSRVALRFESAWPPSVAGVVTVANRFRLEFEIRATAAEEAR